MEFKGFIGSSYQAANPLQDNQVSINYFVEIDKKSEAKTPVSLLSTPGQVDLGQSVYTGQVRGFNTLPGGSSALVVVANNLLLMTIATVATSGSRATFSYKFIGNLNSNLGFVDIRNNGVGGVAVLVDGANLYSYNIAAQTVYTSSDPAFLGSNRVCEIDGWFVFFKPNSQIFYTSPLYWNGKSTSPFDGTYYSLKDNYSDNIVTMIECNRELWLIGESTSEIWYNAGNATFPFSRLPGTMLQVGGVATHSISRHGEGLIWLGKSERGNNQIYMSGGYRANNICTPAIAYQINQYAVVSDAIGYVYEEEGHEFYCLTFPTQNITWCYDLETDDWHQRAGFLNGQFNRQRANVMMNFSGMIITGDYLTGQIYWQTRTSYADGNYPLVSLRRSAHIWDGADRNKIVHARFQIEFGSNQAPNSIAPQAMLRWSNDGGQTWGNEHYVPMQKSGATTQRSIWRSLGYSRDRVYELRVSDPVNRDITGASIRGSEASA